MKIDELLKELRKITSKFEKLPKVCYNENVDTEKRKAKLKQKFEKTSKWIWVDEEEYAKICHAAMTYSFPEDENVENIITRRTSKAIYAIQILNKENNPTYYVLAKLEDL